MAASTGFRGARKGGWWFPHSCPRNGLGQAKGPRSATPARGARRSQRSPKRRARMRRASRCSAMSDLWLAELWGAIGDTVLMVGISALVALLAGIPLALVLVATTR